MNHSVFRAALRASAKVALGAAVAGCGGVVGSAAEHAAPEGSTPDAAAAADATWVDVGAPDEAAACDPPMPSSVLPEGLHVDAAAGISEPTFGCCVSLLKAVPPNDGGFQFPDAAVDDPQVRDCCATVIARLDYEYGQTIEQPDASMATLRQDEQTAASVRWACCQVTPAEGPTCTPWGPPMPPAMPGEVA